VINNTGDTLCYQVEETGIGEKCFSDGTHLYGTFAAGTYSWNASTRCGSASGTLNYLAGDYYHKFFCAQKATTQSLKELHQPEK
jgi:hypothetical protein